MRRNTGRAGSKKPVRAEAKHFPPERLAQRVFVEAPRLFSFSHRPTGSLRHPYLSLVVDLLESVPPAKRVESILAAFLDSKGETEKWKRVGAVLDAKIEATEFDKRRTDVLVSPDVMRQVEALWSSLGGTQGSFLTNDVYRQLHTRLYAFLLGTDDVSLMAATMTVVNEDYAFDARDLAGVSYGSFALSILEIADNWTKSRKPEDYARFLQDVADVVTPVVQKRSSTLGASTANPTEFSLSENVFFSGGVLVKHQFENHVQYTKAAQ